MDWLLPRGRLRLPTLLAWAAALACLLALAHRTRYTADISDEGFALAMPYRFALGDRPFVDEISIQQTSGIIAFPFVWLFVKVTGGSTGLVLFMRFISFAVFKLAAAVAVFALARRWLRYPSSALAVALLVFAYVPYSIACVGYNLVGFTFLAAGSFFAAAAAAEPDDRKRLVLLAWAGFLEGVMVFAYPPLAAATAALVVLVPLCVPDRRLRALGGIVAGGAASLVVLLPSLSYGGRAGLRRSLGWGLHANQTHDLAHLRLVMGELWKGVPALYTYAVIGLVLAAVVRSRVVVAAVIAAITVAIALIYHDESTSFWAGNGTVVYGGAIAPLLLLVAKPEPKIFRGAALVMLPAYAGGAAAAFTSANGAHAAFVGLFAAFALFALLAARALEQRGVEPILCMLPALTFAFVLTTRFYDFVYRDAPIAQETETVKTGPFWGTRTTPDRAQMFMELMDITKRFDERNGRILFLYDNSAFYLFSRMRPSASCVWEVPMAGQDTLLEQWQKYPKGHGLVVKIKGTGTGVIDSIVAPPSQKLLDTRHFTVYRDGP